ncbi:MAG: hypothetical protein WA728_34280 [Xanthobacteraceae bacterium]
MLKVKDNDPQRSALSAVLMQWRRHLGVGSPYTVQEVIDQAALVADFHVALVNVTAAPRGNDRVNNRSLGRWLKKVEGHIVSGLALHQDGNSGMSLSLLK